MRQVAVAGLTLIGLSAGLYYGVQHALHRQPQFYVRAVAMSPAQQRQAGEEFERNVLALHNSLQESGRWERTFTDSQINGWLAVDLPQKLPDLLPPEIRQPRVALTTDRFQIAFQYTSEELSTVVSLSLEITLADDTNTLAVRVIKAQAGWVPIPLADFLDHISQAARQAEIDLRWVQRDGDPVALITIPHEHDDSDVDRFVLELIELTPGKLTVAGRTTEAAE